MHKPNSTNSHNRRRIVHECPMTYTFSLLGNRWKPIILWKLHEGENTAAALHLAIPLISRKMLFQDRRELQERGFVVKHSDEGARPRPTCELTPLGGSLIPILSAMLVWGEKHRPQTGGAAIPPVSKVGRDLA